MTIEITRPETEALIHEYLESGQFGDIHQLLNEALDALRQRNGQGGSIAQSAGRKSLAQLFAESPFKGLDVEFDESATEKDFGRDVPL